MRKAKVWDARQLPAYLTVAQYGELMGICPKTVPRRADLRRSAERLRRIAPPAPPLVQRHHGRGGEDGRAACLCAAGECAPARARRAADRQRAVFATVS